MKKTLAALCAAILIAGCATAPPAPVVQSPQELHATHGFVYVGLPGSPGVGGLELRAADDKPHVLAPLATGTSGFGQWLPAGDYQVGRVVEGFFRQLRNEDGTPYQPVRVEAGRLTDMGGLIDFQPGGYEHVLLPVSHPELSTEAGAAARGYAAYLKNPQPLLWRPQAVPKPVVINNAVYSLGLIAAALSEYEKHLNKPAFNQQIKAAKTAAEFQALALQALPPQTDEPAVDAEGRLYFGADYGQLRVRSADGRWSAIDTGTLQSITAVEADGGRLVAGTASGAILAAESAGAPWRKVGSVDASESVVDIDHAGSRWLVMTAVVKPFPTNRELKTTQRIKLYASDSADLGQLRLLKEFSWEGLIFLQRGMGLRAQLVGQTWYVNSVTAGIQMLDLQTMQWTASDPGHGISGFNVDEKTGTLAVYRSQGAFSKLNVSADGGKSWKQLDRPPYTIYDVRFDTPTSGMSTRWDASMFTANIEFLRYDAAKDQWVHLYEAPSACARLLRGPDGHQRFCLTSGGSILDYVNGNWVAESAVN